jgi:hypothetical protein
VENFGILEEFEGGLVLMFGKALVVPNGSKMSGQLMEGRLLQRSTQGGLDSV